MHYLLRNIHFAAVFLRNISDIDIREIYAALQRVNEKVVNGLEKMYI